MIEEKSIKKSFAYQKRIHQYLFDFLEEFKTHELKNNSLQCVQYTDVSLTPSYLMILLTEFLLPRNIKSKIVSIVVMSSFCCLLI